jgi:hypothetical protein
MHTAHIGNKSLYRFYGLTDKYINFFIIIVRDVKIY